MQSYKLLPKLVAPRRAGGLGSHLGTSLHGVGQEFLSDVGITLIKPGFFSNPD